MSTDHKKSNTINILLWIAQGLLAASLIWSSSMKLFQPVQKLAEMWPWAAENEFLVKFTGVLDLLAAFGLILPALLHIQPKLTVYAAYGTIALMVAASLFHIARGEASQIGVNIFFAAFAAFISWGRQKRAPFTPKQM